MESNHFILAKSDVDPARSLSGWYIAAVDGKQATTLKAFYEQIAQSLDFPEEFNHNLESFDDMINDLEWIDEEKVAIYIRNCNEWLSREKADDRLLTIIDLLDATAEDWKWMDEEEESEVARKELKIILEDTPRIRTLLEEQEIPFGTLS
ncbi:barstar family protein [Telluribacter sp.]|jgi:RNAse (barnase) inhibitor barstar|uniref:barstar family protein n=1 Tax=Telluribacter sp. TaxID=1978767 RepID=UPI002E10EC5D|nr:barstar family protein [Telluribacter sp.]